ncbi:rolling circle replication-associated protein [Lactococcus lactis]|uniref:rolling circle replication-associated protein n=1 Tax=Lactococcus lactis TaxID=1358 RepID=UPI003DA7F77E
MNDDFSINNDSYVTLTMMNDIFEIQYMEKSNFTNNIQKLDADRYVVLYTGEIKEFDKSENRSENKNSLNQTMKSLRYLINANFTGQPNELWITLTFADSSLARNTSTVYLCFNKFIKRLRYKYGKDLEYIAILEPHEIKDGDIKNWHGYHFHLLLKSYIRKNLFIPHEDFENVWGLGWCRIERLNNVDNIGAYLSAYLTNVKESSENSNDSNNKSQKKYIKGARLWLYPKGIRLYRKSKGIKKPTRIKMTYAEARAIIGVEPHYQKKIPIEIDDFQNTIIYEQFNRRRKKNLSQKKDSPIIGKH